MKRSRELLARLHRGVVGVFLAPLRLYSRLVSPALPARCRYYPTCSAYAEQAVRTHGIVRGSLLAVWRLLRCNPFSRGGVDEVPPPGRWRRRREAQASHAKPGTTRPSGTRHVHRSTA